MRVIKHWHGLTRQSVISPFSEIPKTELGKELSNLVWLKPGPAFSSGLDQMTSRGNPQPKLSHDMKVKGLLKKLLSSASLSTEP